MLLSRPILQWDALGLKAFGATPCFVVSPREGDHREIHKRCTCCSSFSSFFPSFFNCLELLPFSVPSSSLFPLCRFLPSPVPSLSPSEHFQDHLWHFSCCSPASQLEFHSLAFRENQSSQISSFHHLHFPGMNSEPRGQLGLPCLLPSSGRGWILLFSRRRGLDPAFAASLSLEVRAGFGIRAVLPTKDLWCQLRMWPWGCQEELPGDVSSSWGVPSPSSPDFLVGRGSAEPLESQEGRARSMLN